MTRTSTARSTALLACALTGALLVAGCGGTDPKAGASTSPSPSASASSAAPSISLSDGLSLTKPGSALSFGQSAVVPFAPTPARSTGLQMTVTSLSEGRIGDLAAYRLDAAAKKARPYYAQVTVKNVGHGDVGKSAVPLFALTSTNTLIGASGFTNTFAKCPSRALPSPFATGTSVRTCLMYLVPAGGTLTGMSNRSLQSGDPIVWKGSITPPPTTKKKTKKKKSKN